MPTVDPIEAKPKPDNHQETPAKKAVESPHTTDQQGAFNKLQTDAGRPSTDGKVDEGYESHYTAIRNATGMDANATNMSNSNARSIDASTSRGEGISRGQQVSYSDSSGQSIRGGQYTNSEGTYFKTTTGDTFKVQGDQNGGYKLEPTKEGQQPFEASRVQVQSNSFGNNDAGDGTNRGANRIAPVDAPEKVAIKNPDGGDPSGGHRNNPPPAEAQENRPPKTPDGGDPSGAPRNNPPPAEAQENRPPKTPDGGDSANAANRSSIERNNPADATDAGTRNKPTPPPAETPEPRANSTENRPDRNTTDTPQPAQKSETPPTQRPDAHPQERPDPQPHQRPDPVEPAGTKIGGDTKGSATPESDRTITPSSVNSANPLSMAPGNDSKNMGGPAADKGAPPVDKVAPPVDKVAPPVDKVAPPVDKVAPPVDKVPPPASIAGGEAGKLNQQLAGADGKLAEAKLAPGADGKTPVGDLSADKIAQAAKAAQAALDLGALAKGQVNPADFVKGADGKVAPVQDKDAGKAAAGADLHAPTLAGLKDGADPSRLANPALKTMVPGLDLSEGQNRALAADVLKGIQATKSSGAEFNLQNFQDLTKGMDARKVENLQAFLFPDGKNQVNDQAAGRLTALLAGQDKLTGSGALDQGKALALGQLGDLAKGTSLADLAQGNSKALMQDIGKVMQDTNKLLTLDGKEALTLAQLIAKTPEPIKGAGVALEGKGALDHTLAEKAESALFVIKLPAGQDPALIKLLSEKAQLSALDGKGEGALAVPGKLTALDLAGKPLAEAALKGADLPGGAKVQIDTSKEKKPEGEKDKPADQKIAPNLTGENLDGTTKKAEKKEEEAEKTDNKKEMDDTAKQEALMALLAEKKLKEEKEKAEKEKERQQQAKKDEETRRRRYIVRVGDTLESIASKQLKDGKLSDLIYDINRSVIQFKTEDDKEVPDLRPGLVIWLPSTADIATFRKDKAPSKGAQVSADEELKKRFGDGWDGTADGAKDEGVRPGLINSSNVDDQTRRENIEKMLGAVTKKDDGQLKYVVRLGDSLKSIAMKHPAMQDVALWKLLASVNSLDESIDEKGAPIARLSRGSSLIIPEAQQIDEYCQQHGLKVRRNSGPGKVCDSCKAVNTLGATICGACGHVFAAAARKPAEPSKPAEPGKPAEPVLARASLDPTAEPISMPAAQEVDPGSHAVINLDNQSRLTRGNLSNDPETLIVSVEVLHGTSWQAVIAYEIHALYSIRYELTPDGNRKGVRIDIPREAAMTLSANDLNGNWKNYRDRYSAQIVSLKR